MEVEADEEVESEEVVEADEEMEADDNVEVDEEVEADEEVEIRTSCSRFVADPLLPVITEQCPLCCCCHHRHFPIGARPQRGAIAR